MLFVVLAIVGLGSVLLLGILLTALLRPGGPEQAQGFHAPTRDGSSTQAPLNASAGGTVPHVA